MEKLLDLIYPPVCMSCKTIFNYNEPKRHICDDCEEFFKLEKVDRCTKCGRKLVSGEYCNLCNKFIKGEIYSDNNFYFTKNYSLFSYNDVTSGTIYNFKYGKKFENVKAFGYLFQKFYNNNRELFNSIDLLIPVPMYPKKERKRGFNQAKILAKEFNKISKITYDESTLFRVKETVVQSSLTPKARHNNLAGAFFVKNNKKIVGKTIMLVDDIYTSGSTIIKCSKELMDNGALQVFSITLAVTEEKDN